MEAEVVALQIKLLVMAIELVNGSLKSKVSSDKEKYISVDISRDMSRMPVDDVSMTIDEYTQYLEEKEKSKKYRLIFTISPLCSNVLFNNVSEIVYKEGSGEVCTFIGKTGCEGGSIDEDDNISDYNDYKGLETSDERSLRRDKVIRDTGYSHPQCGNLDYHCGYDIFNNHMLRRTDFEVTQKMSDSIDPQKRTGFNSISDYNRDSFGNLVKVKKAKFTGLGSQKHITYETIDDHMYTTDSLIGFGESMKRNLVEKDGWFGFINTASVSIPNYNGVTINKVLNNKDYGEFIDMYPDRSLFSFLPKRNKYQDRYEKNWEYVLTYPYKNYYDGKIVNETIVSKENWTVRVSGTTIEEGDYVEINGLQATPYNDIFGYDYKDISDVYLRTEIKHNLNVGDVVSIDLIFSKYGEESEENIIDIFRIDGGAAVGPNMTNMDGRYLFSLKYSAFSQYVSYIKGKTVVGGDYEGIEDLNSHVRFRVRKKSGRSDCKYYFRVFKAIPNFNGIKDYGDAKANNDEIEANCMNGFDSTLNKLAFERTIYNDEKAQIVFDEDVNIGMLTDNLGRDITEVYLTLIKTNKGYDKWYQMDYAERDEGGNGTQNTIAHDIEDSIFLEYEFHASEGGELLGREEVELIAEDYGGVSGLLEAINNGTEARAKYYRYGDYQFYVSDTESPLYGEAIPMPTIMEIASGNGMSLMELIDAINSGSTEVEDIGFVQTNGYHFYYSSNGRELTPLEMADAMNTIGSENNDVSTLVTNTDSMVNGPIYYRSVGNETASNNGLTEGSLAFNGRRASRGVDDPSDDEEENNAEEEEQQQVTLRGINPNDPSIEFSHCFGKLTAGLDLPFDDFDYNVHRIHNIPNKAVDDVSVCMYMPHSAKNLEKPLVVSDDRGYYYSWFPNDVEYGITENGDEMLNDSTLFGEGAFLGDIVELSTESLSETTLEDVYFRFNTAQRECPAFEKDDSEEGKIKFNGEFTDITYDEITYDDMDMNANFTVTENLIYNQFNIVNSNGVNTVTKRWPVNLSPEGYYYKAHNKIQLKKFKSTVEEGYHLLLNYTQILEDEDDSMTFGFVLDKEYIVYDNSYLILSKRDETHMQFEYPVLYVDRGDGTGNRFVVWVRISQTATYATPPTSEEIMNNMYTLFRKNPIKPRNAYELCDGTGKYIWREVEKDVNIMQDDELFNSLFTNGAYYFHKNINFFLKRQDPYGEFGLKFGDMNATRVINLTIDGEYKDVEDIDYVKEEEINKTVC